MPNLSWSASLTSAQRSGIQSFSDLLVPTTIDAIGRSIDVANFRCHSRSSGRGPRSHSTGSGETPSAMEAELDWSVRRAGHDPRLEIDLEIDHEVKPPLRQLRGDISERHQAPGAIEDDYVVDRSVAPHERRWTRLEH